jgi:hypothetical protein
VLIDLGVVARLGAVIADAGKARLRTLVEDHTTPFAVDIRAARGKSGSGTL